MWCINDYKYFARNVYGKLKCLWCGRWRLVAGTAVLGVGLSVVVGKTVVTVWWVLRSMAIMVCCGPFCVRWWKWVWSIDGTISDREKSKWSERNSADAICPPQTPNGLAKHWTWAFAMTSQWLTTWCMARSVVTKWGHELAHRQSDTV